jgi:hypothetical protein
MSRSAGKALFIYFDGRVGTDLGAEAASRTLPVTHEFCGVISLGVYLCVDNNAFFRAGFQTKPAALASLLEDNDIGFSLLRLFCFL